MLNVKTLTLCLLGFVSAGGLLLAGGCHGVSRAGTAYTLNAGRATEATLPASVERVYEASLVAMGDLGFEVVTLNVDATQGFVRSKTARNEDVSVNIDRLGEQVSRVTILIGIPGIGDADRQRVVLDAIESSLIAATMPGNESGR